MRTFLLILLILDSILLVTAILLQSGKGGGLAASFGGASSSSDSFLGTRQAGNLLTKTSWWAGGVFLFLAFVLQILSARQRSPRSILDDLGAPAQSAPVAPGTAPGTASPAVPLAPIPLDSAPATPPQ